MSAQASFPTSHHQQIAQRLPDWLKACSAEQRQAWRLQSERSLKASEQARQALAGWLNPWDFARPLLAQALRDAGLPVGLSLEHSTLLHIERSARAGSDRPGAVLRTQRRSLLQAALQNFARDERFDAGSQLLDAQGNALAMPPEQFARLCRGLDLGAGYQHHLNTVFAPPQADHLHVVLFNAQQQALRLHVLQARLEVRISEAEYLAMEAGLALRGDRHFSVSRLSMWNLPLDQVLMFEVQALDADGLRPCLVYLPGDPLGPLQRYASRREWQRAWRRRLQQVDRSQAPLGSAGPVPQRPFQQLLSGLVRVRDRAAFAHELQVRFNRLEWREGTWQPVNSEGASLHLIPSALASSAVLYQTVLERHLYRVREDAEAIAMPTAQVDARLRWQHIEAWLEIGFDLLNVAGLFVPVLGTVLMPVAAGQLLAQVYEGIQDWRAGDYQRAQAHLFGVLENLAQVTLLGVTQHLRVPQLDAHIGFTERFEQVRLNDGRQVLWNNDLSAYRSRIELPEGLQANDQGQYRLGARTYVHMDGELYEQAFDRAHGQWRLVHPERSGAYRPPMQYHGEGGWGYAHESPLLFARNQLLSALGEAASGLDQAERDRALRCSGVAEQVVRRCLVERRPMPSLLTDLLARIRLDRQLSELPERIEQGALLDASLDYSQMLITELPGWPQDAVLQVFKHDDLSGARVEYGHGRMITTRVAVSRSELLQGQLAPRLVAQLDETRLRGLLGGTLPASPAERIKALRQLLADYCRVNRQRLFEALYGRDEPLAHPLSGPLQRDFPGLPRRLALELVDQARQAEREQLQAGRVPLRLAEEARLYLRQVRISRALQGLYDRRGPSADSRQLLQATLPRVPGWSSMPSREPLEQALLGMPAPGVSAQEVESLRAKAIEQALIDPQATAQALGMAPRNGRFTSPLRLADGRVGYPLSGRQAGAIPRSPINLMRRFRALYPSLDEPRARAMLRALGDDELAVAQVLADREQELLTLLQQLAQWANEPWVNTLSEGWAIPAHNTDRHAFVQALEACWRREAPRAFAADGREIGLRLEVDGLRLDTLPTLSADFSHVGALSIRGARLQELSSGFLAAFPNLRWIDLGRNQFRTLPAALENRSSVTRLILQNNRVTWDDDLNTRLRTLSGLKVLDLSNNPLAVPPDVSGLHQLFSLDLSATAIDRWPTGALQLQALEHLNLAGNDLRQVPQAVIAAEPQWQEQVLRINRGTRLNFNPWSAESLNALHDYAEQHHISFGLGMRPAAQAALPAPAGVQPWLRGDAPVISGDATALWQHLRQEPGHEALFRLLDELRSSADYLRAYDYLKSRVWRVLDAAGEHGALRDQLFELAAHDRTCADGASLFFNRLEISVLVHQAELTAAAGDAEFELVSLARNLERLDQVDVLAAQEIAARKRAGRMPDEAQVYLAFRVELAQRLELPAQPRGMRHRPTAGVSATLLDQAAGKVLAREKSSSQMLAALIKREFWVDYLKRKEREQFDQVNAPFHQRQDHLDEKYPSPNPYQPNPVHVDKTLDNAKRRSKAERKLIEALSDGALRKARKRWAAV
ncbi:NEL-type E3 ubiquitin ligase domain-containing protein [Pseudomonas sp. Irchel 3F5]|uniref:NEL-type E3 ubiquitin ligase domain-containing protein n=1 Tax=Pseudomonas sp. Irchel 3F5 TaxID=2009002 RepID=UPI000BA49E0C|nr:NEL-type E3 ubiquitin ligase domain-containing protein [Pseudomonas sp. Irchel 3F5]